jgi:hypothetical protein
MLDGKPLGGATVVFSPVKEGSSSRGRTNADGQYVLQYARGIEGAVIGDHTVQVTTQQLATDPKSASSTEKVPFKYRTTDALTATVKVGQNTIDFNLEPGPVEPPQPKGKKKGK